MKTEILVVDDFVKDVRDKASKLELEVEKLKQDAAVAEELGKQIPDLHISRWAYGRDFITDDYSLAKDVKIARVDIGKEWEHSTELQIFFSARYNVDGREVLVLCLHKDRERDRMAVVSGTQYRANEASSGEIMGWSPRHYKGPDLDVLRGFYSRKGVPNEVLDEMEKLVKEKRDNSQSLQR